MSLLIKKIFARELVYALILLAMLLIAGLICYILDEKRTSSIQKLEEENAILDTKVDSSITEFRKDNIVDSIFKLQMNFHSGYGEILKFNNIQLLNSRDKYNYFFWVHIRQSIESRTFNFTYASDEICDYITYGSKLYSILLNNFHKRKMSMPVLSFSIKEEFSNFALSNNFEDKCNKEDWNKYERLRLDRIECEEKLALMKYNWDVPWREIPFYVLIFGLISLFGIRYFYYLFKWLKLTLTSE
jgi:hypothetical protein